MTCHTACLHYVAPCTTLAVEWCINVKLGSFTLDVSPTCLVMLQVLCCMDHRVIPEKILGLGVGDAEVIRNGGGRVNKSLIPWVASVSATFSNII